MEFLGHLFRGYDYESDCLEAYVLFENTEGCDDPCKGTLTYDQDDNEMVVSLDHTGDFVSLPVCSTPEGCLPHETDNITGCFRNPSGEHWMEIAVTGGDCNRIGGIVGGVFLDFSSTGVPHWTFNGTVEADDSASLTVQSEGGDISTRTINIERGSGDEHLRITGDSMDRLVPVITSDSTRLLESDQACPPCLNFRTDLLVGSFEGSPDTTPTFADSITIIMSATEDCIVEGSGHGVFLSNPSDRDSEWREWTFEGSVTGDNRAELTIYSPAAEAMHGVQLYPGDSEAQLWLENILGPDVYFHRSD